MARGLVKVPSSFSGCVGLCHCKELLILGGEPFDLLITEVDLAFGHIAVRRLDKAEIIDLGIDAER